MRKTFLLAGGLLLCIAVGGLGLFAMVASILLVFGLLAFVFLLGVFVFYLKAMFAGGKAFKVRLNPKSYSCRIKGWLFKLLFFSGGGFQFSVSKNLPLAQNVCNDCGEPHTFGYKYYFQRNKQKFFLCEKCWHKKYWGGQ